MFIADFDPAGIGQTATIVVIVILVLGGLIAWILHDREGFEEFMQTQRLTGGVILPLWVCEEDLTSVAVQKGVAPSPAWIERSKSNKFGFNVRPPGPFGGRAERGRESKEHVDMPKGAIADLVPRLLGKLHEDGLVDTNLATPPYGRPDVRTVISDPEEATKYLIGFLDERYPDGVDESGDERIRTIVDALHAKAREEEIEQKRVQFENAAQDAVALVESKWRVRVTDDEVELTLQEWSRPDYAPVFDPDDEPAILELPQGVAIRATIDRAGLTERGRQSLKNGDVKALGVFGTTDRYVAGAGRLEIQPMVVFSRLRS